MGASLQQRWQDAQPKNDAPPGHAAPEQRHCKGLIAVVGQARDVRHQDPHADKHLVTGRNTVRMSPVLLFWHANKACLGGPTHAHPCMEASPIALCTPAYSDKYHALQTRYVHVS